MLFGPHTAILADTDWLDMLLPIVIMVVYGAAALAKGYAGRLKDKDRTEATSNASASGASAPRYKPLDEVAAHRTDSPQARTLPYARTAAQASSSTPEPQRQPAVPGRQPTDWQRQSGIEQRRQQDVEQRRLKQTEAISRQKSKQELLRQRQRQIQQQAIQSVKAVQAATSKAISSSPLLGGGRAAQERRRQVRPGKPKPAPAPRPATQRPAPAQPLPLTVSPLPRTSTSAALRKMLRTPQNLRTAMVLREILDKPAAFRD